MKQAGGASSDTAADKEIDVFLRRVAEATPIERIELERQGMTLPFLRGFAARLGIAAARLFEIIELPQTTAEPGDKGARVDGSSGHAALALIDLLSTAQEINQCSTSAKAAGLGVAKWLGRWIEVRQPALGGRRPAELIATPTGARVASRLLGALESGAYQ